MKTREKKNNHKRKYGKINQSLSWKKRKFVKRKLREERTIREHVAYKEGFDKTSNVDEQQSSPNPIIHASQSDLLDTTAASTSHYFPTDGDDESTLSIAVPGSILANAQSLELRTYLAGQVARAAAVFRVDEIVVYDEDAKLTTKQLEAFTDGLTFCSTASGNSLENCNLQLAKILQYLECPQYLRKYLFPLQKDLKFAGLLNPLDCPHHMRMDELSIPFREAVTLDKPVKPGRGSFCYAGLTKEVQVDRCLKPGVRVTVKLKDMDLSLKKLRGAVVAPSAPKAERGLYWGYTVRVAPSLAEALTDCPFAPKYDLVVGTSERGVSVHETRLPRAKHELVVFGGLAGLEACVQADERLGDQQAADLFHYYLNTCPAQGSRTIRTEEAILITLSALEMKNQSSKNR